MPQNYPNDLSKEISRILLDLIKTIKVVSVYPDNNPLPVKLKESFSERFIELVKDANGLKFVVAQGKLLWDGQLVFEDRSAEESLAQMFHGAGITEISFSKKFGFAEVDRFFRVMKAFVNRESGAADLVSLLWQEQIPGFDYCTVDDFILGQYDGGVLIREKGDDDDAYVRIGISAEDDSRRIVYNSIFLGDGDENAEISSASAKLPHGRVPGSGAAAFGDMMAQQRMGLEATPDVRPATLPDTTLMLNEAFAMDTIDKNRAAELIREDACFDMHRSTIELIAEIIDQDMELVEFAESLTIIEKIQSDFLRLGRLDLAGEILDRLKRLGENATGERARLKEQINNAVIMAGSREKFSNLITVLNDDAKISPDSLIAYLRRFGWESLSAVLNLLGELVHRTHREAICRYLAEAGRHYVDIVAQGIYDRRWFVVRNSVTVLAAIGGEKAFAHLEKILAHNEPRVRIQLAKGLAETADPHGVELMVQLIWDKNDLVRQTALDCLLRMHSDSLLGALTIIINDERFTEMEPSSQEKIIFLFSQLGGEPAATYLGTLISGWGFLRNQSDEFYTELAIRALGYNLSEKAERLLLKLNRAWNRKIRRLAAEALTMRRKIKFGEN